MSPWYVNCFTVDEMGYFIATDERTLFSVFVPTDRISTEMTLSMEIAETVHDVCYRREWTRQRQRIWR